jgi:hypothetical protein
MCWSLKCGCEWPSCLYAGLHALIVHCGKLSIENLFCDVVFIEVICDSEILPSLVQTTQSQFELSLARGHVKIC